MYFRNTCIVECEVVVRSASNVESSAAGFEDQREFTRTVWQGDAGDHLDVRHRRRGAGNWHTRFRSSLLFILTPEVFLEFSKGRIDRDAGCKDVDFCLDSYGRESAVTMIVDVIDRGSENFIFQIVKDFRWRF